MLYGRIVRLDKQVERCVNNSNPEVVEAFYEGVRALMDVFRTCTPAEYPEILSSTGKRHILSVLMANKERRQEYARHDAQNYLKRHNIDKCDFWAFLLDVPKMSADGVALDVNGEPLEDDNFNFLPGKVNTGWPKHSIWKVDGQPMPTNLSREEYLQMSDEERSHHICVRTLTLEDGETIDSRDYHLVAELIRQTLKKGDGNARMRQRFCVLAGRKDGSFEEYFGDHADVIKETLLSLPNLEYLPPFLTSFREAEKTGQISTPVEPVVAYGQVILKVLDDILHDSTETRLNRLISLDDVVSQICEIFLACKSNDAKGYLAALITDEDLEEVCNSDNVRIFSNVEGDKRDYFMTGYIRKVQDAILDSLYYIKRSYSLAVFSDQALALCRKLTDCLVECGIVIDEILAPKF